MTDDSLAWETRDRTVAYSCPGFDVITEDVRLPDGTETDFDYLSEPESVAILPLTPDGSVVAIEEWRQAVGRVNLGIPVGGVEPDDTDLEASARRELTEETGYEAERIESLCTVEPANGLADSVTHFFVARGCRPTAEQDLDADETIRVEERSLESLERAALSGELSDARPVLAIAYYRLAESSDVGE
ncbi:NUDIX hydrolase [Halovivax gelatinilyticus]|uniref:NUDIX hydrolase n=1 Tax=Halovivax gelatinilyticus TaxID=2961597 RepID=UPI0020CA6746|nr:NUDIX hydrolase [Halovivax gelatinilyticus]